MGTGKPAALSDAVRQQLADAPLTFVANRGQMDEQVAYYVPGAKTTIYFSHEGVTFTQIARPATTDAGGQATGTQDQRWSIKMDFLHANPHAQVIAGAPLSTRISYFQGGASQSMTDLPTYGGITYKDLWPGIDAVFSGTGKQLKYTFLAQPGADPNQIQLAYRGATSVQLTSGGELSIKTPVGGFADAAPYVYQLSADGVSRQQIRASYALTTAQTGIDELADVGFSLGAYDTSMPLVVDPAVLSYAGYIGGAGALSDVGNGIAVDSMGSAYVTGETDSDQLSFPVLIGPDLTFNGNSDVFVAKINPSGTGFRYLGYIGGANRDYGTAIAVDAAGNAFITGGTGSDQSTFPVKLGPDLTYNGGGDAFVAEVNAAGNSLVYCGYLGGYLGEVGFGIAVDSSDSVYVTGETGGASFPISVGPDLSFNGGTYDAFITKIRPTDAGIAYSGFIGGSDFDEGYAVAVDGNGQAYVTGYTASSQASFPVKVGPDLTYNGTSDAFVTEVNTSGNGLVYSGYIGGSDFEVGLGIKVDASGAAYVAGQTDSDQASFPVKVGPDLTFNGTADAFISKVQPLGQGLVYAGYFGGQGIDGATGVGIDSTGSAYIVGNTDSQFAMANGPDSTFNGVIDVYVARVSASGTSFVYSGYIGGADDDRGYGIAVDSAGNAYVTGQTLSTQASFPVLIGPDTTYNGGSQDAFIAKVHYS